MTLTPEEKNAIIKYRADRAKSTLNEARIVQEAGLWNLAVNRLYYSIFYASLALLLSKGISASSHKGVWSMINLHFVKEGLLSHEDSSLMGKLFTMRHTGDYDDIFDWNETDVKELLPLAEGLLTKMLSLLPPQN